MSGEATVLGLLRGQGLVKSMSPYLPVGLSFAPILVLATKRLVPNYYGAAGRLAVGATELDVGFVGDEFDSAAADAQFGATAASGFITAYDQSGSGNDVPQSTATNRPQYRTANRLRGAFPFIFDGNVSGAPKTWTMPPGVSFDRQGHTVFMVAAPMSSWQQSAYVEFGTATTQRILPNNAQNTNGLSINLGSNSSPSSVTGTRYARSTPSIITLRGRAADYRLSADTNVDVLSAPSAGVVSGGTIGRSGAGSNFTFAGELYALVVYPGALTDAEVTAVSAALASIYPLASVTQRILVQGVGDSILQGLRSQYAMNLYRQAVPLLTRDVMFYNQGLPSTTAATEYPKRAQKRAGTVRTDVDLRIFDHQLGTNDIDTGTTAQTLYDTLALPNVQYSRDLGDRVIMWTIMRNNLHDAAQNTERQLYNDMVRNGAAANNYRVFDAAAYDAQLVLSDGTHPDNTDYALLAQGWAAVVNQITASA